MKQKNCCASETHDELMYGLKWEFKWKRNRANSSSFVVDDDDDVDINTNYRIRFYYLFVVSAQFDCNSRFYLLFAVFAHLIWKLIYVLSYCLSDEPNDFRVSCFVRSIYLLNKLCWRHKSRYSSISLAANERNGRQFILALTKFSIHCHQFAFKLRKCNFFRRVFRQLENFAPIAGGGVPANCHDEP